MRKAARRGLFRLYRVNLEDAFKKSDIQINQSVKSYPSILLHVIKQALRPEKLKAMRKKQSGNEFIPYDEDAIVSAERMMFFTVLGVGAACLYIWLLLSYLL